MKRFISILLIFCMMVTIPSLAVGAESYNQGRRDGERMADEEHSTALYWGAGLPAAFFLSPLIGGTGTITVAYLSEPEPDYNIVSQLSEEHTEDYIIGFEEGYANKAQSKNVRSAWGATGVAFGARLALILATDNTGTTFSAQSTSSQSNGIPVVEFGVDF